MEERIAIPGEELGTEEEFIPGQGTKVDESGVIKAIAAGVVRVDENRQISIVSENALKKLKVGDIVYGLVEEMFESVAFLTLERPLDPEMKRIERDSAIIPVSEIKEGFVKSIRDEIHVGDIVKGVVKEITPLRVIVSLKPAGMGVVKAYCSYDRNPLELRGRTLICPRCGQKEIRHISDSYGKIEFEESLGSSVFSKPEFRRREFFTRKEGSRFERSSGPRRGGIKRKSFLHKRTRF
jgi:exosome complex component CSL4